MLWSCCNYAHALEFVPDCYKTQQTCNKTVYTSPSTIKLVPECYKTKVMHDKAVDTCTFALDPVPDQNKTQ